MQKFFQFLAQLLWRELRSPRKQYSVDVRPLLIKNICWRITRISVRASSSAKMDPTKHSVSLKVELLSVMLSFAQQIPHNSLNVTKDVRTIVRKQYVNSKHLEYRERMADGRQREIRKEHECSHTWDAAGEKVFVVEAANAAIQEQVMMITTNDTTFARVAMKGARRDMFSAACATDFASIGIGIFVIVRFRFLVWH